MRICIKQNTIIQYPRSLGATQSSEVWIEHDAAINQLLGSWQFSLAYGKIWSSTAGFPLLQEYEFRRDREDANPQLPAVLRPSVNLRPYQQRVLTNQDWFQCLIYWRPVWWCNSFSSVSRGDATLTGWTVWTVGVFYLYEHDCSLMCPNRRGVAHART